MSIGRMVKRHQPNPLGGIGGLTPAEEAEASDLLNGPHKACTCEKFCSGKTPTEPRSRIVDA